MPSWLEEVVEVANRLVQTDSQNVGKLTRDAEEVVDNDLLKCMSIYVTEKAKIDDLYTDFMASIVENSNKFIQDSLK